MQVIWKDGATDFLTLSGPIIIDVMVVVGLCGNVLSGGDNCVQREIEEEREEVLS